jgi:4-amino-4-deoxychorismate lyase
MTKSIYPYFESIKLRDGQIYLWPLHAERMERTIYDHHHKKIEWAPLLKALTSVPKKGLYKLRIEYNAGHFTIAFHSYHPRHIKKLYAIETHDLMYSYKYTDRTMLEKYTALLSASEDIVIIRQGQVTDSSYSNLAFFDGSHWYTPLTCLLEGVKRKDLISRGILIPTILAVHDLHRFSKLSLINAMLDLDELSVPIENLYL